MSDGSGRHPLTPQLDINQLVSEAQTRWLRPAEICGILQNYKNFSITPEAPDRPCSGSLFLFDRKVLRYFRKDGHNWRKKKDGKTVKEAHERLKVGSVDVLHCYYAHGEENENFQRRSYWMLEEDFMHIVLVHYLEIQGGRSANRSKETGLSVQVAHVESPVCSNSHAESQLPSLTTDAETSYCSQQLEYEADTFSTRSRYNPYPEMQPHEDGSFMCNISINSDSPLSPLIDQSVYLGNQDRFANSHLTEDGIFDANIVGFKFASESQLAAPSFNDEFAEHVTPSEMSDPSRAFAVHDFVADSETLTYGVKYDQSKQSETDDIFLKEQWQLSDPTFGPLLTTDDYVDQGGASGQTTSDPSPLVKGSSLELPDSEVDGLKKYDSFSRWMSKELDDVDDSHMKFDYITNWSVETDNAIVDSAISSQRHLDPYIMSPTLSQDQLFSITDYYPVWGYVDAETKVFVKGAFLKDMEEVKKLKWSCMFGEIEVPAEILSDGTLLCFSPPHNSGMVPFYVTCSNRLACSEVREFEFRPINAEHMLVSPTEMNLHARLDKLLSLEPLGHQNPAPILTKEKLDLKDKVTSLIMDDDIWSIVLKDIAVDDLSIKNDDDQLLQSSMKEKLLAWLLQKILVDEKSPSILDSEGLGVLHLVSALGYDWAVKPMIAAGVSINFRDANGWTALHWAAYYGRERTVVVLLSLGADPGALSDPTPSSPSQTPADLASSNGHKGIGGFLAESNLTNLLSHLTINSKGSDASSINSIATSGNYTERGGLQQGSNQHNGLFADSLSAYRNASEAAAQIYQVYRVLSFERKKKAEYENIRGGISEDALSLVSRGASKPTGLYNASQHSAATRIQNKFRGWKDRRDFLLLKRRVIKLQALVRGHQVRRHYRKILWSVGIVEKAILRWRRKGCGLRGFRPGSSSEGTTTMMEAETAKDDDYDFLQEGRRQTEARLEQALARVKSMVQYPEARIQYGRLQNIVTRLHEFQAMQDKMLEDPDDIGDLDFMELQELLGDDDATFDQ